jgi:hypothetical protein
VLLGGVGSGLERPRPLLVFMAYMLVATGHRPITASGGLISRELVSGRIWWTPRLPRTRLRSPLAAMGAPACDQPLFRSHPPLGDEGDGRAATGVASLRRLPCGAAPNPPARRGPDTNQRWSVAGHGN